MLLHGIHLPRIPVSDGAQFERTLAGWRVLMANAWLIAFALVGATAIALVARGGIGAYLGLFAVTALSATRIASLTKERTLLRAEAAAVAGILEKIQHAADVREAVQAALGELLRLFDAKTVLLIAHDRPHLRIHSWSAQRDGGSAAVTYTELQPGDRETYLFAMPSDGWYALTRPRADIPSRFLAAHPCESMLVVSASFGETWSDRVFVLDAPAGRTELRVLQSIVRQVGPVLHSLDTLSRIRSRVGAAERARVAHDLHDGIIQSLIGLEMQIAVWRRELGDAAPSAERLGHIQEVLRQEILDLRDLIQQLKTPSIDPGDILEHLAALVERFQRQTGIAAHFVSEIDDLSLSPRVAAEIARIIQEALVNVRKHSGARHVLVRVTAPSGYWKFEIDDDGHGFGFTGRYSQADLEIGRKGPVVIKERVRAIGGTLALESTPGQGARIEVWLPRGIDG